MKTKTKKTETRNETVETLAKETAQRTEELKATGMSDEVAQAWAIAELAAEKVEIMKAELSKAELLAGRAWKAAEKVVRLSPASARYPAIEIWE